MIILNYLKEITMFVEQLPDAYYFYDLKNPPSHELSPGIYQLGYDEKNYCFFFKFTAKELRSPKKIYGDPFKLKDKILSAYYRRSENDQNTGFLLTGASGSGKTILMSMVANEFIERGGIVITFAKPFVGETVNEVIAAIKQPKMILLDEYEKFFSPEDQEKMLTLFDGANVRKTLFGVACNDSHRLNPYMIGRTGRFLYSREYQGLDTDTITSFVEDKMQEDHPMYEDVLGLAKTMRVMTFDLLTTLVEECLAYPDEDFKTLVKDLNFNSEDMKQPRFKAVVELDGKTAFSIPVCEIETLDAREVQGIKTAVKQHLLQESRYMLAHKNYQASAYDMFDEPLFVIGTSELTKNLNQWENILNTDHVCLHLAAQELRSRSIHDAIAKKRKQKVSTEPDPKPVLTNVDIPKHKHHPATFIDSNVVMSAAHGDIASDSIFDDGERCDVAVSTEYDVAVSTEYSAYSVDADGFAYTNGFVNSLTPVRICLNYIPGDYKHTVVDDVLVMTHESTLVLEETFKQVSLKITYTEQPW